MVIKYLKNLGIFTGGGLLTAIKHDLDHFEIEVSNKDIEVLVVQGKLGKENIRIVNAYGPQEDESEDAKFDFWEALKKEVIEAKDANCMVIIQMDANAKLGRTIIPEDCHDMSDNGRMLLDLVESESLSILNASPLCSGVITRHRETQHKTEVVVLDYIIACDRLASFLDSIIIDDKRILTLTKYASTKGNKKIVKSDHNIMCARFSLTHENTSWRKKRNEVFNLKNLVCKAAFTEVTETDTKLDECFTSNLDFSDQCKGFFTTMERILHKCFNKVRIRPYRHHDKEVSQLMSVQTKLRKEYSKNHDDVTLKKIKKVEETISEKVSKINSDCVSEYVKNLSVDGKFSQVGMWKVKGKLFPRERDPPMAKYDEQGKLVTNPKALKSLYINHYRQRLEHRPIKARYLENFEKKEYLWKLRFEQLKDNKTVEWSSKELRKSLLDLKVNKSRDHNGLINELFKPPVIGVKLENALLRLVNGMKRKYFIPQKVQLANISTIYKKKGSKNILENDRGIFTLSVHRKIIDRLVYQEKYPLVDEKMSDSNIGARKNKNIKNHLFIVYAVINDVIKNKKHCIDLQIYDLVKAFDVLWLTDSFNSLWDILSPEARDDRLGLIYQLSPSHKVAVNTAVGLTERVDIPEIVT